MSSERRSKGPEENDGPIYRAKKTGAQLMPELLTNPQTRDRAKYDQFLKREYEISVDLDPADGDLLFRMRTWPINFSDLRTLISYETEGKRQLPELPKEEDEINNFYSSRKVVDGLDSVDDVENIAGRIYTLPKARQTFLTDLAINPAYLGQNLITFIRENPAFHGRADLSDATPVEILRRFDALKGTSTRKELMIAFLGKLDDEVQRQFIELHMTETKGLHALKNGEEVVGYADWQSGVEKSFSGAGWVFSRKENPFTLFYENGNFVMSNRSPNWRIADIAWKTDEDNDRSIIPVQGDGASGVETRYPGLLVQYEIPAENSSSLIALGILDHLASPRGRGVVERYLYQDIYARRNTIINSLPIQRMERVFDSK